MKKGTIVKNNWAGYETYFICQEKIKKFGIPMIKGYTISNIDGKWLLDEACFYLDSLLDEKHYPVVGYLDIDELIKKELLNIIKGDRKMTESELNNSCDCNREGAYNLFGFLLANAWIKFQEEKNSSEDNDGNN